MKTFRFILRLYGWAITILADCDCSCILDVEDNLISINCSLELIEEAKSNLQNNELDTGFTYSNYNMRRTIMVISKSSSIYQFINTSSHEVYHLIQHLLKCLNIQEEIAARITGELNMFILENMIKSNYKNY